MTATTAPQVPPLRIETDPVPLHVDQDGVVRVSDTRVTLDTVLGTFLMGVNPEEIAARYPTVALADIYAVISYYLHHQAEIDQYLQQREEAAERVRRENEARWSPAGVRERLLARQATPSTEAE
jgi:uncharacterized protein (DUF433 family)